MKQITLPKILNSLQNLQYEVTLDADLAKRAYGAVQRMLELSQPKSA
jgi:quinolinate synthase